MTTLSIIILQHNTPDHVERNLKALQTAELPTDTQVIVVNNGGNMANQKIDPATYQNLQIQFHDTPNEGFPKGNNYGLRLLKAKYYAFVNPDIIINPHTIKILIDYLNQHPHVGIVSPQLVYPDGSIQDNYRVYPKITDIAIKRIPFLHKYFKKRLSSYLMWTRDPHSNEAVDWVTGAFILVREDCMAKIKEHDETYFLFMSDVAICREAYKVGYETHIVGQTTALHNDKRVSSGGIKDIFRKKTIRLHILDAIRYFFKYAFQPIPKNAPSKRKKTAQ